MIEPGTICVPRSSKRCRGRSLVVVYRIADNGSLFYDGLNTGVSGAVFHGHQSTAHFLEHWEPVAKMRFEGAYQLYRKERNKKAKVSA